MQHLMDVCCIAYLVAAAAIAPRLVAAAQLPTVNYYVASSGSA